MVRAVARNDLLATGDHARELHGVLVRLRTAVREERDGEVAGRHLGEHSPERRARLVRHRGPDRAELVGLILDRLDDLRVLVPDVEVDELRREVEVALPVVVPEVAALGAGDSDRVDRALDRPGVENVFLWVGADLGPGVWFCFCGGHAAALRPVSSRGSNGEPPPLRRPGQAAIPSGADALLYQAKASG